MYDSIYCYTYNNNKLYASGEDMHWHLAQSREMKDKEATSKSAMPTKGVKVVGWPFQMKKEVFQPLIRMDHRHSGNGRNSQQ
jgi:hypothetical protein